MNDTELDELLDAWKTPPAPARMRERFGAAVATQSVPARRVWRGWKVLVASAATLAIVVLVANKSALSQMINPPPYTVDSEITLHPRDAVGCIELGKIGLEWNRCVPYSRPMHTLMSSYNADGTEVVLSWSDPAGFLEAWLWSMKLSLMSGLDTIHGLLSPAEPGPDDHAAFYSSADLRWVIGERSTLLNSGCRPVSRRGEVIGQENVLGYSTIVSRFDYPDRLTLWMAPQLSCFALRAIVERQEQDGSWTVMSEKNALKVNQGKAGTQKAQKAQD